MRTLLSNFFQGVFWPAFSLYVVPNSRLERSFTVRLIPQSLKFTLNSTFLKSRKSWGPSTL